jgi:release factor glutamine methyltransferase
MTVQELDHELRILLKDCEQPAREARQILISLLAFSGAQLITSFDQKVEAALADRARHWASRRNEGYPLAYLTGKKGFYKFDFAVIPGVLVPRPETEHVVEVALARAQVVRNFVDLGCGSGCLGLSLLSEWPEANLCAIDASPQATGLTLKNAEQLGLKSRTQVVTSEVERFKPERALDLVVANPPYIAEGDLNVQKSVHQHEPHEALYSGPDGLAAIRSWAKWSSHYLRPGGVFVCEIGSSQSDLVQEIMSASGFEKIQCAKDLAGHDRVVSAVKRSKHNG